MTATVFDLAAARRRRQLPTLEEVRARQGEELREFLEGERQRLRAEADRLPRAFAAAARAEADWATEFDPEDPRMTRLWAFEKCRRYDVETGTCDGRRGDVFCLYEEEARGALFDLRSAIAELRKAKAEPGGRRVTARRRMLTEKKRGLLVMLFRFGRRQIDHRELEWRHRWDWRTDTVERWRESLDGIGDGCQS